jgi:Zn-dependent alcohol dehydrogenase
MKTKGAVLWELGRDWEVVELDLDGPRDGEVLIRYVAAGFCHSDEHLRHGDIVPRFPIVGGHEGAGIIEEVGAGVSKVKPGDHVVCSFIPSCGHCRWCATGQQNLCDLGATILEGCMPDGSFRFHADGQDLGAMCMIGTFSQYATISQYSCVKVDDDLPLDKAVLTGCGVPTGWGSAVYAAKVTPGDTVVIFGIGGIGINAVQGAAHAEEAKALAGELTRGVGADKAIVTVDIVNEQVVQEAVDAIRKGGRVVIVGLADPTKLTVQLSGAMLTLFQKEVIGSLFGNSNPQYDITKMLDMYRTGHIKLDELITRTYSLDEVNQGYQDLLDGKNLRAVMLHEH